MLNKYTGIILFSEELHYTDMFKKLTQDSVLSAWFSFQRERQQNQNNTF